MAKKGGFSRKVLISKFAISRFANLDFASLDFSEFPSFSSFQNFADFPDSDSNFALKNSRKNFNSNSNSNLNSSFNFDFDLREIAKNSNSKKSSQNFAQNSPDFNFVSNNLQNSRKNSDSDFNLNSEKDFASSQIFARKNFDNFANQNLQNSRKNRQKNLKNAFPKKSKFREKNSAKNARKNILTDEKREEISEIFENIYVRNKWKIARVNFLRGVFFGLGTFLGGTIIVAILVWILAQTVDIFPWARDFTQNIIDSLRK